MPTRTYKDGSLTSVVGSWRTLLSEHEYAASFKDGRYVDGYVIEFGEFVDYTEEEALSSWPPAVWDEIRQALAACS